MLSAFFYLNEGDIHNLKLNDKIRIDNSWWFINKVIDYNANNSDFTKVELMSIDTEIDFAPFQTKPIITRTPRDFRGHVIRQFNKVNNVNNSEGDFVVKGIGNVVQEGLKGFSEGDVKNINVDGIFSGGSLVGDNFATADLTFTGNRNHDTDGYSLQITTDNGVGAESIFGLTTTTASLLFGTKGVFVRVDGITFSEAIKYSYTQISATYTIDTTNYIVDCTSNTFTVTLPTAVSNEGRTYIIKNSGAGVITLEGDGTETIDGALNQTLNQYDSITVVSNGANWIII